MGWTDYLQGQGYVVDSAMQAKVEEWWGWYVADNDWYSSVEYVNSRTYKVERISVKPARWVCQKWASLLMNERTLGFDRG